MNCPFMIAAPSVDPTGFFCHRCNQSLQMKGAKVDDKFPICIACALVLKVPNAEFAQDIMEPCTHGARWTPVVTCRKIGLLMMRFPLLQRNFCDACVHRLCQPIDGKPRILRLIQFLTNMDGEAVISWASRDDVLAMFDHRHIEELVALSITSQCRPQLITHFCDAFMPSLN